MLNSNNGCGINFENIPINEFWNISDELESKMHRIHSYPAKFPAFITTKALEYAVEKGVEVNLIADVFCGCGTTAYEASRNGKNFWGCDINPVATLIAEAKSKRYNSKNLEKYYRLILNKYNTQTINSKELSNISERIKYWFHEEQINNLIKLRSAIFSIVPAKSHYLKFFLCAFSNILKPTSRWLTKSIKPQLDPHKKPIGVIEAYNIQFQTMYQANLGNEIYNKSIVKIENTNFLKRKISQPFADLIVTSPPYVTSYEYADLHQLSTLWLGYTKDYKSFREGTIGSLYHDSDFNQDIKKLNSTGESIVFKLYNVDKRKAKSAAKYFVDMQKSVTKTFEMLNNNGLTLFVIGNTEYKQVRIDNANHLVESMQDAGYRNIEVSRRKISKKILTPYRDEKGKFTTDKNSRKVYAEEYIVTGRKLS